jgi:hypothetical protein
MIITLKKGSSPNDIEKALAKLEKRKKNPSLKKHFGALKRGLNGLVYQKEMRRED